MFCLTTRPSRSAWSPSVGAATALFAATIALVQNDIKRVLAYSTISQLGYMFLGCGVAAYSAAIFHLMTHAFFKALLFLAAGSVIHAIGGEQDLRKMGGLRKKLPVTFWTMTAAVLAIAGFFPFAGFFSKDAILYAAFLQGTSGKVLWFVGVVTALLTSFYMFRLWYLTFMGESRSPEVHPHESPWSMRGPLVILPLLSICGGWIGIERFGNFLAPFSRRACPPRRAARSLELILSIVAVLVALEGWLIADKFYRRKPERPAQLAAALPGGYKLLANKYYVDEIYGATIVKPLLGLLHYVPGLGCGLRDSRRRWPGCSAALPPLQERFCNAGNRAICALMRRGWPRARRPCCSFCWFRGQRFWPIFLAIHLGMAGH